MSCDEPLSTLVHYRAYQSPLFVVRCGLEPHCLSFLLDGYAGNDASCLLVFMTEVQVWLQKQWRENSPTPR